jgi:hypothetical protein
VTSPGCAAGADPSSAVLYERRHHLDGEALHALPGGISAAYQHVPDADCLQRLQPRDDLLGRCEEGMGLGRAGLVRLGHDV